jgi:hypothetical protein
MRPTHGVRLTMERVPGIEPALSAWESDRSRPLIALAWASDTAEVSFAVRMSWKSE